MLHEGGDDHVITYAQDMAPLIASVLRDIPVAKLREKAGYSDRQLSRFRSSNQPISGTKPGEWRNLHLNSHVDEDREWFWSAAYFRPRGLRLMLRVPFSISKARKTGE